SAKAWEKSAPFEEDAWFIGDDVLSFITTSGVRLDAFILFAGARVQASRITALELIETSDKRRLIVFIRLLEFLNVSCFSCYFIDIVQETGTTNSHEHPRKIHCRATL